MKKSTIKVAVVHDWLTNLGGAERTVASMLKAFPDADLYTSVYDPNGLDLFKTKDVKTTFLQKIPSKIKFKHQLWVPLRPFAFRRLKLDGYDLIISSSSAEAKQASGKTAKHLCYCHTPIRYFWVNPDKYKKEPGLGPFNFMAPLVMPLFLKSLKKSDFKAAQKVDQFVGNSKAVKNRIKKFYNQDSIVINPPLELDRFSKPANFSKKRDTYVTVGRQVAYKRHDLAIQACTKLNLPLVVLGGGPEHDRLKKLAGPSVKFIANPTDKQIDQALWRAKAFLHPGEEDFGITPIEALAAGCPVIAYKAGGALDYVQDKHNGLFFNQQTVDSLVKALGDFPNHKFSAQKVSQSASKFSEDRFIKELQAAAKKLLA